MSSEQSIREQAKESFDKEEWDVASALFTLALDDVLETPEENSNQVAATLLSNRAACLIRICDFDNAIVDLNKSFKLNPTAKAIARLAEAHLGLRDFKTSKKEYDRATIFSKDDKEAKERYKTAARMIASRAISEPGVSSMKELDLALIKARCAILELKVMSSGGPGIINTAVALAYNATIAIQFRCAHDACDRALVEANNSCRPLHGTRMIFNNDQQFLFLCDAILDDVSSYHEDTVTSLDDDLSMNAKIRRSVFDIARRNCYERFLDPTTDAAQVISHYNIIIFNGGQWQASRIAMAALIRGSVIQANTCRLDNLTPKALEYLTYASELLVEGMKTWIYPEAALSDHCGSIFQMSFLTKVQNAICMNIIDGFLLVLKTGRGRKDLYNLAALKKIANEILRDCKLCGVDFTTRPDTSAPYYDIPIANANKALAIAALEEARQASKEVNGKFYPKPKEALEFFKSEAKVLRLDSPQLPDCILHGLACQLLLGGSSISEIFAQACESERAFNAVETWCVASLRKTEVRTFCRKVCDAITLFASKSDIDDFEILSNYRLKPIGSTSKKGFELSKTFSLNMDDFDLPSLEDPEHDPFSDFEKMMLMNFSKRNFLKNIT